MKEKLIKDEDNQPSTSDGRSNNEMSEKEKEKEIVQMWKDIDKNLEDKAKSLNLTSLNVKSILHHLIKFPNAIDVLAGVASDNFSPNVRTTRSKTKNNDSSAQESISIRPANFLDVNYDESDENDDDYVQNASGESEDDDKEEDDRVEDEEMEQYNLEDDLDDAILYNNVNLNDSLLRCESAPIPTLDNFEARGDEYQSFLASINTELEDDCGNIYQEDDPNDVDFNQIEEEEGMNLNIEDYEFERRYDKTTEIPQKEIRSLLLDTILVTKDIPAEVLPPKAFHHINNSQNVPKTQKVRDAETIQRLHLNLSKNSCSLIRKDKIISFRQCEIDQLVRQMEQHVQLLTQFIVTCNKDEEMQDVTNMSQVMINELDNYYQNFGPNSIFNISNLGPAIDSCHHIINMQKVDKKFVKWTANTEFFAGPAIRPEAAVVLSKSAAIIYPSLLPKVQPSAGKKLDIAFTKSEDLMLALGLMQFCHLPRRTEKNTLDRYTAINQYCLPSREPIKIRNHLKTIRAANTANGGNPTNPVHAMIVQAENGCLKLECADTNTIVVDTTMEHWPKELQPNWYKKFTHYFEVDGNIIKRKMFEKQKKLIIEIKDADGENMQTKFGSSENQFVQGPVGTAKNPIIIDRSQVEDLINQIFPPRRCHRRVPMPDMLLEDSPPKKKTPKQEMLWNEEEKLEMDVLGEIQEEEVVNQEEIIDEGSISFVIPPTPGKGYYTADPHAPLSPILDHIHLQPKQHTFRGDTTMDMMPKTPGASWSGSNWNNGDGVLGKTDFSHLMNEEASRSSGSSQVSGYSRKEKYNYEECSIPSDDEEYEEDFDEDDDDDSDDDRLRIDDPYDDHPEVLSRIDRKLSRKRSRMQRETSGKTGIEDLMRREEQKLWMVKKILEDVKARLFMHQEKWHSLVNIMKKYEKDDKEKIKRTIALLRDLPDIMHLVLLYAPVEHLPEDILLSPKRITLTKAFEMLFDIESYYSAVKGRPGGARSIYKLLLKCESDKLSSEEAAKKMYEQFGHERPLWERFQKKLYCLADMEKPEPEDYEFIDLTIPSHRLPFPKRKDDPNYEVIDDLDQVGCEKTKEENWRLRVNRGQMQWKNNKQQIVPLEITQRKWTRNQDLLLLTRYNTEVMKNPNVEIEDIQCDDLPFGKSAICSRLHYLVSIMSND